MAVSFWTFLNEAYFITISLISSLYLADSAGVFYTKAMNYLLTFLVVALSMLAMGIGIIFAKKILRKSCSADPNDPNASCACKTNAQARLEDDSDDLLKIHPTLKKKNSP